MHRNSESMLWMGDLESYMDADFIGDAFRRMGETVLRVKIIMDKYDGHRAGYCFVELDDVEAARRAMLQINGKIIPNSRPPIKFNLSFANNPAAGVPEYNLFVNNLPDELGDAELYQLFGKRYVSCRGAKVYRNPNGTSRGMGFVRFGSETDQQRALVEMNRQLIFGRPLSLKLAPIRVKAAKFGRRDYDPAGHYSANQDFYNSSNWQMYDLQRKGPGTMSREKTTTQLADTTIAGSDADIEPYEDFTSLYARNEEYMKDSEEPYSAMMDSCWFPMIQTASVAFDDL